MTGNAAIPGLIVKKFVVGPLGTNCYVVADPVTRHACVIDPGAEAKRIKKFIEDNGLDLRFILNTHGHGDHIAANAYFKVPIFIHKLDADCLADPDKNLSRMFMAGIVSPEADKLLEDNDIIKLGGLDIKILHTPGHTQGSVSALVAGAVFTGDALFAGSIGRTDLENGDHGQLIRSISEKLLSLNDNTLVYPGHGESSTIGREKASNPFFS